MSTLLAGGRVFAATDDAVIDDGAVLVEGAEIVWVGRSADAPAAAEVIDCSGRTVLPGLIDAHAHLVYHDVTDTYSIELAKSLEEATIDALENAALLLRLGFTGIRDVGARGKISIAVREAVAQGRMPGPRVKACKQIISVWGGLGDFHPTHIFGREQYRGALTEIITGPWEARNAVRQQVKDGVDWVKVEASGTGFSPLCPAERDTMSEEELRAVVDEATEKGRPVACHAESRRAIIKAARAGVRTIEHAIYLDDEGLQAVIDAGVAICPTLALYTAFAEKGLEFGIPREVVENHRRTHEHHVAAIRKAYEAGVTIIAGSDAGLANFPTGGGLEEICSYVELIGMTPAQALTTATRAAADVVGFGDAGTLEPGKRADVLIIDGNPLENIRVMAEPGAVQAVIQGGALVSGALRGSEVDRGAATVG